MTLTVGSPVAGTVVAITAVPDPVFAEQMVGPGTAVEPADGVAVAPVDGTVVSLHPHAFVLQHAGGAAVLVHLGIDTVELAGEGFTLHVAKGDRIAAGDVVVHWDPDAVRAGGRSAVCPVVLLESGADQVDPAAAPGAVVAAGTPLLTVRTDGAAG
ncbi:PTS sugar transporter subunit IIA [Isoptericola jiangsuensis]|uniref:PTS sugar transporter subunit IIA n=1 Tax=Isoptericola jiangsuensis TaxID=548579 RepID=UPI003AADDA0F